MHCESGDTIYHAEVRCLSHGHKLARLFDLRDIQQFLQEKDRECRMLRDHDWLYSLAFLVDMTKHLNALNTVLHGKEKKKFIMHTVKLFQLKLKLFRSHISVKNWVL
jgi:N-glycosylase/DNA lyase